MFSILCTLFLWIVHLRLPLGVLHLVYPISLDCSFKTTPRVLHLVYPISLDCSFKTTPRCSPSCVPYFSGLFISFNCDYPSVFSILCTLFLWIVHLRLPLGVLHLVYPISLDCSFKTTPRCSPSCVPYFSGLFI